MKIIFITVIFVIGVLFTPFSFAQIIQDDRKEELKKQMSELQSEINNYRGEIKEKQKEEKTLGGEIAILNSQISKTELELQQTALAFRQTELVIESNNRKIVDFEEKTKRRKLRQEERYAKDRLAQGNAAKKYEHTTSRRIELRIIESTKVGII